MYKQLIQSESVKSVFAERLKELLEKSGLNQTQTAKALLTKSGRLAVLLAESGLDKNQIERIETEILANFGSLDDLPPKSGLDKNQIEKIKTELPRIHARFRSWLKGRTEPNFTGLLTLAEFYKVSVDDLLGRKPVSGTSCEITWTQHRLPRNAEEANALRVLAGNDSEQAVKQAIDSQLVRITHIPCSSSGELEEQLVGKFKEDRLRKAIIIPCKHDSILKTTMVGYAAARYFTENVEDRDKVGLIGGSSTASMVACLLRDFEMSSFPEIDMYPIAIHPVDDRVDICANALVGALARYRGGRFRGYALHDSGLYIGELDRYLRSAKTEALLWEAEGINKAFIGIGSKELFMTLLRNPLIGAGVDISELNRPDNPELDFVGDLLYRPINIDGVELMDKTIGARICSIPLLKLENMVSNGQDVVAVVGGKDEDKVESVYGVIKGRYINVLIATEYFGGNLLDYEPTRNSEA